ncbi:MAG TPA: DUF3500 domain-containing protein [Bryobacteraceae bacterium]|nr:DUF3500 domain-containing protein [Bryobacteraceae bacterium]
MCQYHNRRSFLVGIAALGPAHLRSQSITPRRELARDIAKAANAFNTMLRPELRSQWEFPFGDPERKDWSNLPHFAHPRKGVRIGDLNIQERLAAHVLVRTILSSQGYGKALAIMERDEFLGENDGRANAATQARASAPETRPRDSDRVTTFSMCSAGLGILSLGVFNSMVIISPSM